VQVPLQSKQVIGIVKKEVTKPNFDAKPLSELQEIIRIPSELLELLEWLRTYYPAPLGQITSLFVPSNLSQKGRLKPNTKELKVRIPELPPLTKEQSDSIDQIIRSRERSFLLHGDTGTGKTRVYLELAKQTLGNNQSVIILTPEIGLTPQLVEFFSGQFPDQTVVMHSNLTPARRRMNWLEISQSSQPLIVIGPRSALFSPLKNLGLIVVDEAHDQAYKQEQSPHYQTTRVAAQLAKLHNSKLILGGATPNVTDYYAFKNKGLPIIRMTTPAISSDLSESEIQVVSIKERDNFTRSVWLSNQMLDKIQDSLANKKQSLVFLNRRGSARVVMCQNCGWQALCPRCDIPLTYHGDKHSLRCHTCGYGSSSPSSCPTCHATEILYKSVGTKAITDELSRHFPEAQIARFDSDNLVSEQLDKHHDAIQNGKIDILVGTQLLTKGLDLPKLAVVGVVTADTALTFPDYTAEEIAFQQISQIIGRVGRGHVAGSVVIQTYYPENSSLNAAVNKNYSLFYEQQILERKKFLFPPFSYVLKLSCGRKSVNSAKNTCENLHTFIESLPLSVKVIGPAPSFREKQNDLYYWQLIIKSKKRDQLTAIIKQLPNQINYDIDPNNLL
jgi:primosomal protein N' (replication factor Y)